MRVSLSLSPSPSLPFLSHRRVQQSRAGILPVRSWVDGGPTFDYPMSYSLKETRPLSCHRQTLPVASQSSAVRAQSSVAGPRSSPVESRSSAAQFPSPAVPGRSSGVQFRSSAVQCQSSVPESRSSGVAMPSSGIQPLGFGVPPISSEIQFQSLAVEPQKLGDQWPNPAAEARNKLNCKQLLNCSTRFRPVQVRNTECGLRSAGVGIHPPSGIQPLATGN